MGESKQKKLHSVQTSSVELKLELTERERFFLTLWLKQGVKATEVEDKDRYMECFEHFDLYEINDRMLELKGDQQLTETEFSHANLKREPGKGDEFSCTRAMLKYVVQVMSNKEAPMPGNFILNLYPVQERMTRLINDQYKAPSLTKTAVGENQ